MIILYWALAMFILWVFFVNVMWLKENEEKIPKSLKPFAWLLVLIGVIWDALFNITFGTIQFLQFPDFKNSAWHVPLLTHRLRRIIKDSKVKTRLDRYRYNQAIFICRYLIEPWDKGHCGL